MNTESISFRPRNGLPAQCFWEVRKWCDDNGFSMSDVFNAMIVPLAYFLENYCVVHPEQGKAEVILNIGRLDILHVFQGKMYPLLKDTNTSKDVVTSEAIAQKIAHWKERNCRRPSKIDLLIQNDHHKTVTV